MPVQSSYQPLAPEDFVPGFRYWDVRPGFEWAWTVAAVETYTADVEVYRGGAFVRPEMVRVTYRDGRTRTFTKGEPVAIQGPWSSGPDVVPPLRPVRECSGCLHGTNDIVGYVVAYSRVSDVGVSFEDIAYVDGANRYGEAVQQVHAAQQRIIAGEVRAAWAVVHCVYVGGHRTG